MRRNKRRALGQHFLIYKEALELMVNSANLKGDETVLEIGTGDGRLTKLLCKKAKKVISFEIDPILFSKAKKELSCFNNCEIINDDAFKNDVMFNVLISNLPYSKSRQFIEWIVRKKFKKAVVTLQKEFVNKLLANVNSKNYRAVSVIAQTFLNIKEIAELPASMFNPQPKVGAKMVFIEPKRSYDDFLAKLIKNMFNYRSKKVVKVLNMIIKQKNTLNIFNNEAFLDKRVEQLNPEDFVKIAERLRKIEQGS
jgi:16S rRNA (adenine1518-N6/adenine1519-N6)-dimethyltransferase